MFTLLLKMLIYKMCLLGPGFFFLEDFVITVLNLAVYLLCM